MANSLGPLKEKGVHLSEEWITFSIKPFGESRDYQLTALRVKIKNHNESKAHLLCANVLQKRKDKTIETVTSKMVEVKQNATERLFRTAYYIAKSNRPFMDHEELVVLQKMNGIDVGLIQHSRFAATSIVDHIATDMKKKVVAKIVASESKISVLIDESTTTSNKTVLAVHIKCDMGNGKPIFIFFDLIELEAQTAEAITAALLTSLLSGGFTEEFLRAHWIAFAADGASVMMGKKSGVATRLCSLYPRLIVWHCLNHRLELSVTDACGDIGAVNHFHIFMDCLYSLYSSSPKNMHELTTISEELGQQCLRIGRILSIRWVSSSFRSLRAVWINYQPLCLHFQAASVDEKRDHKDRQKYVGLLARLRSPTFVCDLGLMYDALQELSTLSLELQKRSITIPQAEKEIKRTTRILSSFKEQPGEMLQCAINAKELGMFRQIELKENNKVKSIHVGQFIQSLVDRMNERLCFNSDDILNDIAVLDKSTWPTTRTIRYGENEVRRLAEKFNLNVQQTLRGMTGYVEGDSPSENLKPLLIAVDTIPCGTAECERDFSAMNLIASDLRSRLNVKNVCNLMFLNINGPPLHLWNPKEYVQTWLLKHRSADDNKSRKCKHNSSDGDDREYLWKIM